MLIICNPRPLKSLQGRQIPRPSICYAIMWESQPVLNPHTYTTWQNFTKMFRWRRLLAWYFETGSGALKGCNLYSMYFSKGLITLVCHTLTYFHKEFLFLVLVWTSNTKMASQFIGPFHVKVNRKKITQQEKITQ